VAKFDVSVIGELNLDLILYGLPLGLQMDHEHLAKELSITLGSSSAIFAHNLALLGDKVGFSSCIGSDPLGEICIQRLTECGVELSRVRRFVGKTTGLTIILPQGKQRFILTYPGTMVEMSEQDLDFDYILDAKHLHVSSYFLQKSLQQSLAGVFRRAKEAGLTTSLDTNDDPEDHWSVDPHLFQYVDILLPNEREACKLARLNDVEEAAEFLAQRVPVVVVKRGSQGSMARSRKEKHVATSITVDTVDSVGAGDSFDAGFIHEFIRGRQLEDCLKYANVTAALSATRAGGTEAFRDPQHREAFLRKHAAGLNSPRPVSPASAR
jgi:sugar/nucleoside kinase (ribokinase family)